MRKRVLGIVAASAFAVAISVPALAVSDNDGCPPGWVLGDAVSDDAMAIDERGNNDGNVCGHFLKNDKGKGNGEFIPSNVVVKDNNYPAKD